MASHEHYGVPKHGHIECLFNNLFRLISKKTTNSALLVHGEENQLVTDGFPLQRTGNVDSFIMSYRISQLFG